MDNASLVRNCEPLQFIDPNLTFYVYSQLGDRCATPSIVTPTTVVYLTILTIGLIGNVCTCLVIIRNRHMHTPTNYYLFSLAISDLLMLVLGLPAELYGIFSVIYPYSFGEFVCKLRAFLIEFTSYASILTITAFSIERWCAICYPLQIQVFSRLDRAVRTIIAVWICAFIAALPVANIVIINRLAAPQFLARDLLEQVSDDNRTIINTEYCAMDFERPETQKRFIFSAFFIFFLLPAVLITVLYTHIVCRLMSSNKALNRFNVTDAPPNSYPALLRKFCSTDNVIARSHGRHNTFNGNSNGSDLSVKTQKRLRTEQLTYSTYNEATMHVHEALKTKSKRNTVKILCAVVVMFFLCWLPFHVQRLLTIFINEIADPDALSTAAVHSIFNVVFYISGYFFYSNSACNPILYNILSQKFRMAFCKTIFGTRLANKIFAKASQFATSARTPQRTTVTAMVAGGENGQPLIISALKRRYSNTSVL